MYSVTVYVNSGNGEWIHPVSGTYGASAVLMDVAEFFNVDNLVRIEIVPSV